MVIRYCYDTNKYPAPDMIVADVNDAVCLTPGECNVDMIQPPI